MAIPPAAVSKNLFYEVEKPFLLSDFAALTASLFFARMVDVVYTDVAGNSSPTLAFTNGIGLGVAPLWSG